MTQILTLLGKPCVALADLAAGPSSPPLTHLNGYYLSCHQEVISTRGPGGAHAPKVLKGTVRENGTVVYTLGGNTVPRSQIKYWTTHLNPTLWKRCLDAYSQQYREALKKEQPVTKSTTHPHLHVILEAECLPVKDILPASLKWRADSLDGYFITATGRIISTRKEKPAFLQGSRTPSGHYYTLGGRSYCAGLLGLWLAAAGRQGIWPSSAEKVAPSTEPRLPPGRTLDPQEAITGGGYVLATVQDGRLLFGTRPTYHVGAEAEKTAKAEAERVAAVSGKKVVVLKVIGAVTAGQVVWE
jgi:hypothetical protein